MKHFILLGITFLFSTSAFSAELSEQDTGSFVLLGYDQKPKELYYRISKDGKKWIVEGKNGNAEWQNISCDSGCDYHVSSSIEATKYLPPQMLKTHDISCIQNIAQAFCRYSLKSDEMQLGYVIIALVTGKPIPMFLKLIKMP